MDLSRLENLFGDFFPWSSTQDYVFRWDDRRMVELIDSKDGFNVSIVDKVCRIEICYFFLSMCDGEN